MEHSATSERPPALAPPTTFHGVMRHFPTGVAVLTTVAGTRPVGMTAGSVTSLSMEPELLMACVRQGSRLATAVSESGWFVVNVLEERQSAVAQWFASPDRFSEVDEFAGIGWVPSPASGYPLLEGVAGVLECRTTELMPVGDHVIAVGEVAYCEARPSARPLLRYTGQYHAIGNLLADR